MPKDKTCEEYATSIGLEILESRKYSDENKRYCEKIVSDVKKKQRELLASLNKTNLLLKLLLVNDYTKEEKEKMAKEFDSIDSLKETKKLYNSYKKSSK